MKVQAEQLERDTSREKRQRSADPREEGALIRQREPRVGLAAATALPRTRTGKRVEVPIKRLMLGVSPERAVNLESLANPEAMQWFVEMASSRFQRSGVRGVSAGKTDAS